MIYFFSPFNVYGNKNSLLIYPLAYLTKFTHRKETRTLPPHIFFLYHDVSYRAAQILSAFVVWFRLDHSHSACPNSESIVSLNSELSMASFCTGRFPHVFMKPTLKTSAVRPRILTPDFCFSITFMSARSFSWHKNYFSFLTSLFGGS